MPTPEPTPLEVSVHQEAILTARSATVKDRRIHVYRLKDGGQPGKPGGWLLAFQHQKPEQPEWETHLKFHLSDAGMRAVVGMVADITNTTGPL